MRNRRPPLVSIVIPAYNRVALTQKCLEALLTAPPSVAHEVVVVDDASSDETPAVMAAFGHRIRVVRRAANSGFATVCNEGAAHGMGRLLVFLNNDTLPVPGWLDALVDHADRHPQAAVVGCKLLFPNHTIQHAGVVICQDRYPRHIYAGFPADHPVVNRSRQFQVVTGACALIRREVFEELGGFDSAFRNGFEDVDLCLRIGERGRQVHYCHASVVYHLESVSEGRFAHDRENVRLYRERWADRLRPDDVSYYLADGLLAVAYPGMYPLQLAVSPLLASVENDGRLSQLYELLGVRSRQVYELLREIVRLTTIVAEKDFKAGDAGEDRMEMHLARYGPASREHTDDLIDESPDIETLLRLAHEQLLQRDEELQSEILRVQGQLARALEQASGAGSRVGNGGVFSPGPELTYRDLVRQLRVFATDKLPAGANVLVVSRGDAELVRLEGLRARHFPCDDDGVYAGYHPSDSEDAVAHLESWRCKGAEFLILPRVAFWWLEHYPGFADHLDAHYRRVAGSKEACVIYDLGAATNPMGHRPATAGDTLATQGSS